MIGSALRGSLGCINKFSNHCHNGNHAVHMVGVYTLKEVGSF